MAYTASEQELVDGLQLALKMLDARVGTTALTNDELDEIDTYQQGCSIHIWTYRYCKECNGIILALTCKEGEALDEAP